MLLHIEGSQMRSFMHQMRVLPGRRNTLEGLYIPSVLGMCQDALGWTGGRGWAEVSGYAAESGRMDEQMDELMDVFAPSNRTAFCLIT